MNEQQFEQYNSIPDSKFTFAHEDSNLHDKKLDTKAVSFARDSFRRFCKNKSSVVAAVILGIIILMAIFVPVFTGYDIERVSAEEQFLQPKLFEAGTGFWDGTKKYEHMLYDQVNETPANFYAPAVIKCDVDEEPTYINTVSKFGQGGFVMFENQLSDGSSLNVLSSDSFSVNATGNYSATIVFDSTDDVLGGKLGEYEVYFKVGNKQYLLQDWSSKYGTITLNISEALAKENEESAIGNLTIALRSQKDISSYLLIESCVFSTTDTDSLTALQEVGFTDATQMVLIAKNGSQTPRGYWSCTGRKGIYASIVYYCNFIYDTYAAVYDMSEIICDKTTLDKYIEQGWCTYDETVGPTSFVKLSDDCPIEEVVSQKLNPITGKLLDITIKSYRYKLMGYDKMPKFLFGTDSSGIDVFTRIFKSLRTSLFLGVCTFLFCFLFGLVWGSISGYFGGWVDLSMERFTDILGGVPWIVVMTLCILHLGNNFFTFFLALCLTGWMGTAGLTRTQFYRFKNMEHVLAARTLGAGNLRLIFKHILPNSMGTIITSSVLMIPSVIYSEASLAYLNLGLQGTASFGVMLSENQQYIQSNSYLIVIPSIVMALLMISFNLFGNGLRDAFNPTLKGSEG